MFRMSAPLDRISKYKDNKYNSLYIISTIHTAKIDKPKFLAKSFIGEYGCKIHINLNRISHVTPKLSTNSSINVYKERNLRDTSRRNVVLTLDSYFTETY